MRRIAATLIAAAYLASTLTACSKIEVIKVLAESPPPDVGRVGVSVVRSTPEIEIEVPTRSKAEGLGEGMAGGAAIGARAGAYSSLSLGPIGVYLAPYFIGVGLIVGSVTGGVYGLANAENAETVLKAEAAILSATDTESLQQRLQSKVIHFLSTQALRPAVALSAEQYSAPDRITSSNADVLEDVDTALMLRITDVHSEGGMIGSPFSIVIRVNMKLITVATGEVVYLGNYRVTSRGRELPEWAEYNGEAVRQAYDHVIHTLASEIVHENFLLYYAPEELMPQEPAPTPDIIGHTYWTGDEADAEQKDEEIGTWRPRWDGCYLVELLEPVRQNLFLTPKVETLTPRFHWKPFPRHTDLDHDPEGIISSIDKVLYDLEIYNSGELVHYRYGLTENRYLLQDELDLCEVYSWSVRARFNQGSYMRATEWSGNYYYPRSVRRRHVDRSSSYEEMRDDASTPVRGLENFKTPCPPKKPEILQE
ncbi:MAG: hypothetical protein ABW090_00500 [Sedimenticola sp.]